MDGGKNPTAPTPVYFTRPAMQPNRRSAYLIIRQGNRWTDVFRLENGRSLVIGRASSNEIPVADERASRRHAEVFFQNQDWFVRDLGSRNGTTVDGDKIDGPRMLVPGNQISVASCRMTFVHSLEDFVPPLPDGEPGNAGAPAQTLSDIAPAITHRQSKAALLESRVLDEIIQHDVTAGVLPSDASQRVPASSKLPSHAIASTARQGDAIGAQPPVAVELLQLAFELAQQTSISEACDLALRRLLQTVRCSAGGVLRLGHGESESVAVAKKSGKTIAAASEQSSAGPVLVVLAAHENSGRAYHPVSDTILGALKRDPSALLARNIATDEDLLGKDDNASSHVLNTSSVIVSPLRIDQSLFGLIHLYSRRGEPDLTPDDLEVSLAIADVLAVSLKNLLKQQSLETKLTSAKGRLDELEKRVGHGDWVGNSESMKRLREQVARVAPTQATILIRGESGSGKELIARSIHDQSARAAGPFIAINCAALTPTLLESELFGHEKGAFTGATDRKLGKFELANGGTLMLDELGEMSLEIQAKFLRVLEGQAFERVGGGKSVRVDVRVIAATNRDLEQAVKDGDFRSDLYFRLRVIELRVPSLRQRVDDIMPLAEFFLRQFRNQSGHGPQGFSPRAQKAMLEYSWPGNVRELKNSIERAFVLAPGELAEPEDLALSYLQVPGANHREAVEATQEYRERTLDEIETEHIQATLKHTGGQKNRAAAILGIERSTLDRKLKKLGENPTG